MMKENAMVAQWSGTDPKWPELTALPAAHHLPDEDPGDSLGLWRGLAVALPLSLGLWGIFLLLVRLLVGG